MKWTNWIDPPAGNLNAISQQNELLIEPVPFYISSLKTERDEMCLGRNDVIISK